VPDYAPHGNYEIWLDPEQDRVIRIAASGFVNLEMLRLHNHRANEIVEGFKGGPYAMICNFNGGMVMTPEAEDAWITSAVGRVARGLVSVSFFFDSEAEFKTLVRAQVTRVLDAIGVPWQEAENEDEAMNQALEILEQTSSS
jgi:predicted metal-dependent enzyme (double-stranded beta helix superfamily)